MGPESKNFTQLLFFSKTDFCRFRIKIRDKRGDLRLFPPIKIRDKRGDLRLFPPISIINSVGSLVGEHGGKNPDSRRRLGLSYQCLFVIFDII